MNTVAQQEQVLTHETISRVISKLAQVRFGLPFRPILRAPKIELTVQSVFPSDLNLHPDWMTVSLALARSPSMMDFDTDGTLTAALAEAVEQSVVPYNRMALQLLGIQQWEDLGPEGLAELSELNTKLSTHFHVTTYVHHFLYGWYIKAIEWYVDDTHRLLQISATAEGGFMSEFSVMIHFPLNSND